MATTRGSAVGTGPAGARLNASEWVDYLETVLLVCCGMPTRVQVLDGAARERCGTRSAGMPLRELRLDEEQDLLEVALGGSRGGGPALRCYLHAPHAIIAREGSAFHSMVVVGDGGASTLIEILGEPS
jgi:hypothetical protein